MRIIILGAGLSGLAAASDLISGGIDPSDITILDAHDKIGGRISTIRGLGSADSPAELGATFIHGTDANPIFTIARDFGILQLDEHKLRCKVLVKTEDGCDVAPRVLGDVDFLYGSLMISCEDFFQLNVPSQFENESVGDFMLRRFDEEMATDKSHFDYETRKNVFMQRLCLESFVSGTDVRNLSLALRGQYTELPGIHYRVPGGFDCVVNAVRANIPDSCIRLNTVVSSIKWTDSSRPDIVTVRCADGEELSADHVICTCSLGVLKQRDLQLFSPILPDEKLNAIERLEFGVGNKLLLEFDEAVFPPNVLRLELIWSHNDDDDDDQVDKSEKERPWYRSLFSIDVVPGQGRVLQVMVPGEAARQIEYLSETQLIDGIDTVLRKFLRRGDDLPRARRAVCSRWCRDPYIRGCYMYVPVGCPAGCQETLQRPLPDPDHPRLCFAGEHTDPNFFSTTHGALLSGQREAKRLLKYFADNR